MKKDTVKFLNAAIRFPGNKQNRQHSLQYEAQLGRQTLFYYITLYTVLMEVCMQLTSMYLTKFYYDHM